MLIEPLENVAAAPFAADSPLDVALLLGSKLALVATATPAAVMLEPAPVAYNPVDPTPDVITEPPLR